LPVDDKYIVVRLLRNLKYIYLSEDKSKQAYKVIDLIVGLEPDNVFEIKDRGMIGFRIGHQKQSIEDLKRFLEKEPVGRSAVEASSVLELLERNYKKW
jgi:regulator of sirC expression with transglutaminase-like and TPR domain